MKNIFKILLVSLGFIALAGFSSPKATQVLAEEEPAPTVLRIENPRRLGEGEEEPSGDTVEEVYECKVVLNVMLHGKVKVDKTEGHVGDIVTVTANPDLFYLVEFAEVNGSILVEDEETRGLYKFALVEGDNRITIKFAIDKELLGEMSTIYEQASNKDWTNLFTIENVITLIKWLLDGGILIAMVRYFIKDKRLADKVENKVKESCEKIIPEAAKNAVIENTKLVIEPMFNQVVQDGALARQLMGIMVKCMVLMQQNTPEAKIAILDEFEKLKGIVDLDSIANIKKYIEEAVANHTKAYEETLARINSIGEKHQEAIEEKVKEEPKKDNGTQI